MIIGIIMASGFSRRMKRDKLLLEIDGSTIIEKVLIACKVSKLDDIMIIYRKKEIKEIADRYNIKSIYNENAVNGQSESVKLGLMNIDDDIEGVMFIVGDQPYLDPNTIDDLIIEFRKEKDKIIVPIYGEKKGNPVIFPTSLKEEFFNIDGDVGGKIIINKFIDKVKFINIENYKAGIDIDTWEEYENLKEGI
ncbi:molybdenum hydroxylase accessory protein, YgfJ family [Gottschalkia acidurici 9a]|uniref:Molybdenum hydroxylase accessory protein, YgfJ family n=1 Tax=Gottschalkia acidurici (strain ATCC 7906 / DSM 604 / BCRC 14475 / CIP 104303 / KCTC 5404 / NCIMB 10678 / 9a) TaxID=1128398 RepID=K0B5W1_GOTA9|nr:molybdenum cofactor cytidylyltransferase [Gottschalkia acidurici]AFS79866.1 molybdenum hydroxylase accessory protein, YgfJ family [Gottschalkia acidurici 9a]